MIRKALDWWRMTDHKNKMEQSRKEVEAIYETTYHIQKRISALRSSYGWDKKPARSVPEPAAPKPDHNALKEKLRKK